MIVELSLALSIHLNASDYALNSVHPHIRLTDNNYITGVFYNSDYEYSFYLGYKYDWLEFGAVTGYTYGVQPYLRAIKDGFFVAPAVYGNNEEYGLVAGYEFGF
jgi:hypothetical protein